MLVTETSSRCFRGTMRYSLFISPFSTDTTREQRTCRDTAISNHIPFKQTTSPLSTGFAAQRIPSSSLPSYPLRPHWTMCSKPCSNQQQRTPASLLAFACIPFVEGSRSSPLPDRSGSRMLEVGLPMPEVGSRHKRMTWIARSVSCGRNLIEDGKSARVKSAWVESTGYLPIVGKLRR